MSAIFLATILAACSASALPASGFACGAPQTACGDPHSHADPAAFRITHLDLKLEVDFDQKRLAGWADLTVRRIDADASALILDTQDLDVLGVSLIDARGSAQALEFRLGAPDLVFGAPLEIGILGGGPTDEEFIIRVRYQTRPEATGLQWLEPRQTAGKKYPFLFTQSQAIHARTWIPLQDTPQVRFTYTASIRVPDPLLAVMSAANEPDSPRDGVFGFVMPQPIPSYLMALAVGDLDFSPIGSRTGVYAEPKLLEAAATEFADTEKMLEISEDLYGPYRWQRYDLLILPPSFPYGGMENPRLSFITPTVIAGDRSLVALIAHELAHSWSGNLVTNATWGDLWLNEGFTVFFESRIMEAIFGERRRQMEDALGYQSLVEALGELDSQDQILAIDLEEREPDDNFTDIPYEKGRLFLAFLEDRFGREAFDGFLKEYFDHFAFCSITTEQFVEYLDSNLMRGRPGVVSRAQLEQWLNEPGLPESAVLPESDAFEQVAAQRTAWLAGDIETRDIDTDAWTVHEWLYFLNKLPDTITNEQITALDRQFALTASTNNKVAHSWLRLAILHNYEAAYPRLEQYLISIGRTSLIKPLYEELAKTPEGLEIAKAIYAKARPGYHPQTAAAIDKVIAEKGLAGR